MRNFGQFCRKGFTVSVLVIALACSTLAGDIPYPGVTATDSPTLSGDMQHPVVSSSVTTSGEMQFPGATVDPVTEIVLSLLQGAALLF